MGDPNLQPYNHQPQYSGDRQQQQAMSSGLARYQSAPSSYFASLLNSTIAGVDQNCIETDQIFAPFIPGANGPEGSSSLVRQNSPVTEALHSQVVLPMKHDESGNFQQQLQRQSSGFSSASQTIHHNQSKPCLPNHSSGLSNQRMDDFYLPQMKNVAGGGNTNLIRQSSSPAGFFSNFDVESGYGVIREMGNFGGDKGTNLVSSLPSPSRFKGQIDFPSGPPRSSSGIITSISETENKNMELSGSGFPFNSWDDADIFSDGFLKRLEDDERKTFSGMNASELQNDESGDLNPSTMLSHHLSLPKNTTMEKLLQLQDSVPCKIRAKRGCATHPRSIAERVRRTRISERMRKLQELVPNMDKQTNTSDMLELAVDYIKDLQKQVKTLSDNREKCTCSNQRTQ